MAPTRILLTAVSASLLCLGSCGKESSPAPAPAAQTTGSGAPAATPPMQGRSASRASQLHGIWMAVTDGDLDGIEFLKDDKAMLTIAGLGTMTLTSNLIDGGRLTLTNPQGETLVFQTTISGDNLELVPEQAGEQPQRFERVPSGQTLAAAIQAREAKLAEQMQKRITALHATLAKGHALLVPEDGQSVAWSMALQLDDPARSLNGAMILDERPGTDNPLAPVRLLPLRGEAGAADSRSDRVNLVFQAGPATEPTGQQNVSGIIRLSIDGPVDRQTITGTAQFPALSPHAFRVTLKTDPAVHTATVARFESQRNAVMREIDAMREILGGRTDFIGQRTLLGRPGGEPVRLSLAYNEVTKRYDALVTTGNRVDQAAIGAIEMLLGHAAIYVVTPWGEQWRLQQGDEPGMLFGPWRPNANADFISHGNIELTTVRRWSTDEIEAERAAIRKFLEEDLRSPQRFTGFVERQFGATNISRWPVGIEIQSNPDGSVTGSAWLIAQRGGVALTGNRSGMVFNLTSGPVLDGSIDFGSYASQRWLLEFAGFDPTPVFNANLTGTRLGGGRVELTAATPEAYEAGRARLLAALSGVTYSSRTTDTSTVRDDGAYYTFTPGADGRITGQITGNASKWNFMPPALIEGSIVNDHGMPVFRATVTPSPNPARGQDGQPFEIDLLSVEIDGVTHLTGATAPAPNRNQDWFLLTPYPGPVEMDAERTARLAAHKLGATAVIPTDPKPGDTVLLIVNVTERDVRVGQLFYADGKYTHRNSIPGAAVHAGLAVPGETCVVRLTYGAPFTQPVVAIEQNGMSSQRGTFRENNTLPTFTIERVPLD